MIVGVFTISGFWSLANLRSDTGAGVVSRHRLDRSDAVRPGRRARPLHPLRDRRRERRPAGADEQGPVAGRRDRRDHRSRGRGGCDRRGRELPAAGSVAGRHPRRRHRRPGPGADPGQQPGHVGDRGRDHRGSPGLSADARRRSAALSGWRPRSFSGRASPCRWCCSAANLAGARSLRLGRKPDRRQARDDTGAWHVDARFRRSAPSRPP